MKRFLGTREYIYSLSLFLVLIDQYSKYIATKYLPYNISIKFIPGLINLRKVNNTGAAFSLLEDSTFYLGILSLLASILLVILIYKKSYYFRIWEAISIAFLLSGSLGNGIDRWRLGYVIDFIELIPINFPIFNFADISINFAIVFFFISRRESRKNIDKSKSIIKHTVKFTSEERR